MECSVARSFNRFYQGAVLCGPLFGLLLLSACGGGQSSNPTQATPMLTGSAQKGPFLAQAPVQIFQLDSLGNRTGSTVTTLTDAQGKFKAEIPWSGPSEMEAEGRYYDELNAANSAAARRLRTVFTAGGDIKVNLNLFTDLVAARTLHLMNGGTPIATALNQATGELQTIFQLQLTAVTGSEQLDVTDGTVAAATDNANLLLFSAAILSAGISDAAFAELRNDFADDGLINGQASGDWLRIRVMATTFTLDTISANIQRLTWVGDAPDFSDLNNSYPSWVYAGSDTDADGLNDDVEILTTLTDPMARDTDQDTLDDGLEVDTYGTNPLTADSDNDLIPDAWEISNTLDPVTDDASDDNDGDGLNNLAEFQNGTDPRLADSDADGYGDKEELTAGGDPLDAGSLPLAFTSSPGLSVEATQDYSYPVTATWPGVELTLTASPQGMTIDGVSGLVGWTPALADNGDHSVVLTASAQGYTVTQSFVLKVDPFNTGDINEDGIVDSKDVLLAQRISLGLVAPNPAEFNRADVKPDGVISAADALLIERLALGL